ncbi:MAG: hypothetical protein V4507_13750 [Verrucomicrobiota bacterium]
MGLWNSPSSVDREKLALEEKQKEIQRQIQALHSQVHNLSQNKSDPKPPAFQEEEIRPLEGHHPYHSRKKEASPSLRSHQNRDRNFFFLFMGVFGFFIYLILHFWK